MKFGVREICDVVLKAKAAQKVGNKVFYKNEPVCYFDSLKTSSLESAATTVYAQGGRGNARLVAWEGERTVTFTMEDALISPIGFMILSGAGLIEASDPENGGNSIKMHTTERTDKVEVGDKITITLKEAPYVISTSEGGEITGDDCIYVMVLKDDEVISEPYIADHVVDGNKIEINATGKNGRVNDLSLFEKDNTVVLVDYYIEKKSGAFQVDITPDKFGGNYYLEASTLFRDTNGIDMPAEFVIPNCKVQSNFTFTMAASGDPSTFTFTMDAFPDYTRWNKTKKVLAAIQVLDTVSTKDFERLATHHDYDGKEEEYNTDQKPYIELD